MGYKNPADAIAYRKRYYQEHKAQILAQQKVRSAAIFVRDPVAVRAERYQMTRAWAKKHPERTAELQRAWRQRNHDQFLASRRTYYKKRRERTLPLRREAARLLRAEMIAAYGGRCVCCGEAHYAFLTIDHINRDGKQHRQSLARFGSKTGSHAVYVDLKKRGWPQDGYRLFCMSCNFATRHGETCPHVETQANEMLAGVLCS